MAFMTVNDCRCIDIRDYAPTPEEVGIRLNTFYPAPRALYRILVADGRGTHPITLICTHTPRGGVRWWLHCTHCLGLSRHLYRPWVWSPYRCRTCHDLTYDSVRRHDVRIDRLCKNPTAVRL